MEIAKSIEAEKAYLAGTDTRPFREVVGYEDIEEYFIDKKNYLLGELEYNVYDGKVQGVPATAAAATEAQRPTVWLPYAERPFLWHGNEIHDPNTVEGYDIVEMGYIGGSIVSGAEDMSLAILIPESLDFGATDFLAKLADFLGGEIDNNDIMIDGLKVCGSMSYRRNGMFFFAAQVAFVDHTEEIARICHKDSGKKVGYVTTGITKAQLTAEVKSWLKL